MFTKVENRVFERVDKELPVRYSPQGLDAEFSTFTKNISGGGLRMPILKRLAKGTLLDMEIMKPKTDTSIRCRGKIVWIWDTAMAPKNQQLFDAGIKFIDQHLLYIGQLMID